MQHNLSEEFTEQPLFPDVTTDDSD
jgi:hypothetical protein